MANLDQCPACRSCQTWVTNLDHKKPEVLPGSMKSVVHASSSARPSSSQFEMLAATDIFKVSV